MNRCDVECTLLKRIISEDKGVDPYKIAAILSFMWPVTSGNSGSLKHSLDPVQLRLVLQGSENLPSCLSFRVAALLTAYYSIPTKSPLSQSRHPVS